MKNKSLLWMIPVLVFVVLAPFTPYLDIAIEKYFYEPNHHFSKNSFFTFMYNYGIYPCWIVAIPAMLILIFSSRWKKQALFLVATLAIGSGVIVHAALKDHWGRPRPKQVIEFGGTQEYRPFYRPNFFPTETLHGFPCGHCSVGFYFLGFVFLGWRLKKRWLTAFGWVFGLGLGTLLSITRMAQGGHFFSDVLVAALIMWLTALIFDWLLYEELV